jgi:hypothetical protein
MRNQGSSASHIPLFAVLCVASLATTSCHESTSPTRAFSASVAASADTLAIEVAVAEHFRPWLAKRTVVLDSRFGLSVNDEERPRARTQELARMLAIPIAHAEDAFDCREHCPQSGELDAMAIGRPTIRGDTARIRIHTLGVASWSKWGLCYDEDEIVTRTNGAWVFLRAVPERIC